MPFLANKLIFIENVTICTFLDNKLISVQIMGSHILITTTCSFSMLQYVAFILLPIFFFLFLQIQIIHLSLASVKGHHDVANSTR